MKKLLALILCVMMFVAVIPTAAFAYTAESGDGTAAKNAADQSPKFESVATAKKAITNLGKDINAMYTALAADQTVFGTAKTIYDMTDALSKDLLKGVGSVKDPRTGATIYEDDLAGNVRKSLNKIIGNQITNYMNDRTSMFIDSATGNVKPDKYLKVWGDAVKSALSSEKAQKNIEAIVTGLFAMKVQKAVNDGADDLYDEIVEWDNWGEFNWGTLIKPYTRTAGSQGNIDVYTAWNPVALSDNDNTALISTGLNNSFLNTDGTWFTGNAGIAAGALFNSLS
jgi:hypothetical protein